MKTKICVLTIVVLLISSSFAFATVKNDAVRPERVMVAPHSPAQHHPILNNVDKTSKIIKPENTKCSKDAPEPNQSEYLLWQDNFEGEDDVFYYGTPAWVFPCPDEYDDNEFGVRFTARRAGSLDGAYFYWYGGTATAQAIVHVYPDDGTGYPGTELGNLTVTPTLGTWNYVDLTSLGINVNTTDDFFITYSVVSIGDTLKIVADDYSTGANRSVEKCIDTWGYMIDDWGADYEFCIDAVIGVDQGPWIPKFADTWQTVTDSFHSLTHSMWIDDDPAFNGTNPLITPPFICPTGCTKLDVNYWYNSDFVDIDGDGDGYLDDYWEFYIGKTEDGIAWHSSTYNAYGGGTSWYAGSETTHQYGESSIYYLTTPDIDLSTASAANLTCKLKYETETPGGEDPPYDGWDVANVEISVDNWETYSFLDDPAHPYNVTIAYSGFWNTHNPADTISFPGWGGSSAGWIDADFDLIDYLGETVQIRFVLASDPASVFEGFWVDNVDINADGTPIFSDYDEENLIPDAPIIPLTRLEYSYGVTTEWISSATMDISTYAGEEIVLGMGARIDGNYDGGDGAGFWFDDVTIIGSNLPPHDAANMFNVIPYPTTAGVDLSPGIVYGNLSTTTEAPQLLMDVEGIGITPFDFYNNSPEPIGSMEYGLAWLTQVPTTVLEEGTYTFTGWTVVGDDADPTNDTLSIDIDVLPAGEYELGYNSRIWAGTYYTSGYCGSYFTPFTDGILDSYTINSVKTLLINYGADNATDTETIEIFEAIDDTTPGALIYTEDFAYTGGVYGTYEWATFDLATPQTLTSDFFVMISGDWVDGTPGVDANYFPLYDHMVKDYIGHGAYSIHTVYWTGTGWAHSSGDRFVNTLGTGTPHSIDPGHGYTDASYLRQNSPNPFKNETTIQYNLKGAPHNNIEINIYNVLGQLVDTVEGKDGEAVWNPKGLSSGIYLYKLTTDNFSEVKKMVIIK